MYQGNVLCRFRGRINIDVNICHQERTVVAIQFETDTCKQVVLKWRVKLHHGHGQKTCPTPVSMQLTGA